VCDMYVGVPQCMDYVLDNLWCSNFKNLCVPKFLPTLYIVFHPFSSMLPIVHVNKPVTTIYMIFVDFPRFFLALQAPKPMESILFKTGPINWQNWSVYRISIQFTDLIQNFQQFEFCTSFDRFVSFQ
jgi:hypothetical protein